MSIGSDSAYSLSVESYSNVFGIIVVITDPQTQALKIMLLLDDVMMLLILELRLLVSIVVITPEDFLAIVITIKIV